MRKPLHQVTMYDPGEYTIVFQDAHPLPYLHWHKELQIIWIKSGIGTALIGTHTQTFQSDEIYIIGSNQPHLFKSFDGNPDQVHTTCLYIDHHQTFSYIQQRIPELGSLVDFLQMADHGLQVPQRFVPLIAQSMRQLSDTSGFDRFVSFLEFLRALMRINRQHTWNPLSTIFTQEVQEGSQRLNQIYAYTLEHYREEISLERIASVACMTPNAFCAYFKRHTHKTYFSFLNELRISEACKKLVSGRYATIAEVAYDSGFINAITFNRVFRKTMSMTPSAYLDAFGQKQVRPQTLVPFSQEVFY